MDAKITLEKSSGTTVAVRVQVTPEMLRLAQHGAKMCGATPDQTLLWAFREGIASFDSFINDGSLSDAGPEPHEEIPCVMVNTDGRAMPAASAPRMAFEHTGSGITTRLQVGEDGTLALASTLSPQSAEVFSTLARRWAVATGFLGAVYFNRHLGTLDLDVESCEEVLAEALPMSPD